MKPSKRVARFRLPPLECKHDAIGTWFMLLGLDGVDTSIFCPGCGVPQMLSRHRVNRDGLVLDGWFCRVPDCGLRGRLTLVDYAKATPTVFVYKR